MANERLKPVKGVAGLFLDPRGNYVVKTSAKSEKTGKMRWATETLDRGTLVSRQVVYEAS